MGVLNEQGTTDIELNVGDTLAVLSQGSGAASILVSNAPGNQPLRFTQVGTLKNAQATYGPFAYFAILRIQSNNSKVTYGASIISGGGAGSGINAEVQAALNLKTDEVNTLASATINGDGTLASATINGDAWTFTYANGKLTTASKGGVLQKTYTWSGSQLTSIS